MPLCSKCDSSLTFKTCPDLFERSRRNDIASPDEIAELRSLVEVADRDISDFDSLSSQLMKLVMRVHEERQAVVRHKNNCLSLMAPIHQLPNEIVAAILLLAIRSGSNRTNATVPQLASRGWTRTQ
jgi:hypothetical protein